MELFASGQPDAAERSDVLKRFERVIAVSGLLALMAAPAHAQVASLGKGWSLDAAGSVTSAPGEVISGRNSIKGSYSGSNSNTPYLTSDPNFIQFAPNRTYTISVSYRILTAGSRGFDFGFFAPTDSSAGGVRTINGSTGETGTATLRFTLKNFPDYVARFIVAGTGAVAVDDIRITDDNGRLVVSETAEGPTIEPGPLNFQLTDAIVLLTEAKSGIRSAAVKDINGDAYPETILTFTTQNPSNVPIVPIIVEASGRLRVATSDFFPTGMPTLKHSPMTLFVDIDGDGRQDLLFGEAGADGPGTGPDSGSRIGVALNLGGGMYRDVSSFIPADQQTTRSYAIAVGDVLGDGRIEIVLPDENNGANTALLRWNGNGFDEIRNWIPTSLWTGGTGLRLQAWMVLADLDKDGKQDLLVSSPGSFFPNLRLVFGAAGGFASATNASVLMLPDGPFGHSPGGSSAPPVAQGAEVSPVLVADFNNDGLPDIFATERQYITYQPGAYTDTNDPNYANLRANGGLVYADCSFQVLLNQGSRKFQDVTPSPPALFGRREYQNLMAIDMNLDGFLDVVGTYSAGTSLYGGSTMSGTTLFLNDGTGMFQAVDGTELLVAATTTPSNGRRLSLGSFLPTVVTPQRTEGILFESLGNCPVAFCPATSINLYKVVANGALGTGPNFADSASLGVPGFNEFYYLRHYADAAAAVQAGTYRTGLAHYVAVGAGRGYLPHAPTGVSLSGGPSGLTSTVSGSTVTLMWQSPSGVPLSYVLEAGSSSGTANLAAFDTGSTSTTFTATNVAPGTYFVRVRARTAAGASAPSNWISVTVGGGTCAGVPSPPTALVTSVFGHAVTLNWQAPNSGCPATAYVLEAGSAPGLSNLAAFPTGNSATTFSTTGVPSGVYYVRIRAANGAATSGPSGDAIVTVP